MEEVKNLFEDEFVLRIRNSSRGGYIDQVNLETLEKGSNEKKATKLHKGSESGRLPNYLNIGLNTRTDVYVKSVGKLAIVPIYSQHADDMMGLYYSMDEGYAVIDKNQRIVYVNDKNRYSYLADKYDVSQMIYTYGPCALALVEPKHMNDKRFVEVLKTTYQERVDTLTKRNKDATKIAQEKELFEKSMNILEKENNRVNEANIEF